VADISIVNSTTPDQRDNTRPTGAMPIGPLLIVSALEEAGYTVHFQDYQTYRAERKPSIETFYRFIKDAPGDIIGLNAYSSILPTVLGAVRRLKAEFPRKMVILGGPSPTDTPVEIMRAFPVDVIVLGEGELTVVDLMRTLEDGGDLDEVAGIVYRRDAEIRMTPRRPRVQDLDSLPLPAYHRINFADYGHMVHILTARGCPYQCKFCSVHSIWERQVTYRTAESIERELRLVRDQVREIRFADDTFVLNKRRVREMIALMRKVGLEVPWRANGRLDLMDDDLLAAMGESGCQVMMVGLESGSNRVLRAIKKETTIEQAYYTLRKAARYIRHLDVAWIWGFPVETLEDLYETVMAVAEICRLPTDVWTHGHLLCAFPKSTFYQEHRQMIRFDTGLYPSQRAFMPSERLSEYQELVSLIREYPEIFAGFYYFDHPELEAKRALIDKLWPTGHEGR
jgi:anaerobic magnesium-protoporphyrin IX monomethyl ester cyclase